jgi:acyl dehydratase
MPIDPARAIGASAPPWRSSWAPRDVILYHLGLGAGADPTDPRELAYTYEEVLRVLPTFATTPAFPVVPEVNAFDGIEVDYAQVLHGSQSLELRRPLPACGDVTHEAHVAEVWDKGKAAVITIDVTTSDADGPLCSNRFTLFARGAGGFGGDPGPPVAARGVPPERDPDVVHVTATAPHQALLYRLSGDPNPLHVDPEAARLAGFDRPILHGLCSYGIGCRAVVDGLLDGDVGAVARYDARFAGVVYPGEHLEARLWREGGSVVVQLDALERGTPVLTHAVVDLA